MAAGRQRIDWDRVNSRFQRWYKANQERFHDCMFTEDDIARSAYYAGIESAMRKPPIEETASDR